MIYVKYLCYKSKLLLFLHFQHHYFSDKLFCVFRITLLILFTVFNYVDRQIQSSWWQMGKCEWLNVWMTACCIFEVKRDEGVSFFIHYFWLTLFSFSKAFSLIKGWYFVNRFRALISSEEGRGGEDAQNPRDGGRWDLVLPRNWFCGLIFLWMWEWAV